MKPNYNLCTVQLPTRLYKVVRLIKLTSSASTNCYKSRRTLDERAFSITVVGGVSCLVHVLCVADSSDIVDQKLKLIMGLIWSLILHYSISMPMWDDEDPSASKDQTPKQRLLDWVRSKIPEKNITNFTSDWNDGTAIAALVDALGPGRSIVARTHNHSGHQQIVNTQHINQLATVLES